MSKLYDDYINETFIEASKMTYPATTNEKPNYPSIDPKLAREIRDRAIINLAVSAAKSGHELSYGDILLQVDGDASEKEYENSKASKTSGK